MDFLWNLLTEGLGILFVVGIFYFLPAIEPMMKKNDPNTKEEETQT